MKRLVFGEMWKRAGEFFRAAPDGAAFTGSRVSNINGPRIGPSLQEGQAFFEAVDADERDLLAVRRPTWHGIAIYGRNQVADRFAAEIVDADEAVVASMRDEGNLRTIGGPLRRIIFAAHEGKCMCRRSAGYRRSPELPTRGPNGHRAVG